MSAARISPNSVSIFVSPATQPTGPQMSDMNDSEVKNGTMLGGGMKSSTSLIGFIHCMHHRLPPCWGILAESSSSAVAYFFLWYARQAHSCSGLA